MQEKKKNLERSLLLSPPFPSQSPALFLDRDGVVIEDCHYVCDPNKVRLCLGSRELIEQACRQGIPVVLVTNQSGISRGFFQWENFEAVNERMQELLGPDAPLSAIYANGYGPSGPVNSWRKPSPKMLLEAAMALNLDLNGSIMIGDRLSDLQAGAAAGVATVCHVLSGHGLSARNSVVKWHRQIANTLSTGNSFGIHVPALKLLDTLVSFPDQLFVNSKATQE
ncbi:D-glycero-D-manno-heptose 1/7-bisphosphate phosphatase [Synechococcus sp. PROS-9-1]|nr:D-glycero-D-manno-heptose 1/7-bisphosphate phosphatase [Synechococcus sp. PROS-9-1]